MKRILKPNKLPLTVTAAGILGLLLQIWLFSTTDDKGFVASGHISETLTLVLTAAVILLLILMTRGLVGAPDYRYNFPASLPGFAGTLMAAAGIAVESLILLSAGPDTFQAVTCALGVACSICLVFLALCRREGHRPNSMFLLLVCLYMMVRLVSMYRRWSVDPQVEDYCYPLLATACLMLTTYHRALFNAGMGRRRPYVIFSLASLYFCCLSLVEWANIPVYLGCAAWMYADQCSLEPVHPDENLTEETGKEPDEDPAGEISDEIPQEPTEEMPEDPGDGQETEET